MKKLLILPVAFGCIALGAAFTMAGMKEDAAQQNLLQEYQD